MLTSHDFWRDRVNQWDIDSPRCLAPLSSKQKDVLAELRAVAIERPLPRMGMQEEPSIIDEPAEPVLSEEDEEPDITVPVEGEKKRKRSESFSGFEEGSRSIASAQDFLKWFSDVENDIITDDYSGHIRYLGDLKKASASCVELAGEIDHMLDRLQRLTTMHEEVSEKSSSLHRACEHILAEQAALCEAGEEMQCRLTYFSVLDDLMEFDNHASLYSKNFAQSLAKLDSGIAFLKAHPKFKDSGPFLARYEGALYRGLAMIRNLVTSRLNDAFDEIYPNISAGGSLFGGGSPARESQIRALTLDQAFPFLYGRYRAGVPEIRSFVREVEMRTEEFQHAVSILNDLQKHYFSLRKKLLFPVFQRQIQDIIQDHQHDKCSLLINGSHCLKTVCHDESDVFSSFFDPNKTTAARDFIAEVCAVLYDSFRPIFVHVVHLETLTELGVVGKAEVIEESSPGSKSVWVSPFNDMVTQIVEDVRERLVFATHLFINRDILGFTPSPGDVAYPEKLEMMESIAESIMRESEDAQGRPASAVTVRSHTGASAADLLGMWYPTVRRTLVCLSKLYRSLDKSTFEGLSQEALAACIASLLTAAEQIRTVKASHNYMDGQLFVIKHLLILREQIFPFHAEFVVKEMMVDFSRVKDAVVKNLVTSKQLLSRHAPSAILHFLLDGVPDIVEHIVDSKRDIDMQLKQSCTALIHQTVGSIVTAWSAFVNDMQSILATGAEAGGRKGLPDATVVAEIANSGVKNAKAVLPVLLRRLRLYLANPETEFILFRPIKTGILNAHGEFELTVRNLYCDEDLAIINCPTKERMNIEISSLTSTSFEKLKTVG